MTEQEQFKACAELDGFINIVKCSCGNCDSWVNGNHTAPIPDYNTYDAIIPLIQKQFGSADYLAKGHFFQTLRNIMEKVYENPFKDYWHIFNICMMCSPSQLREALLRAAGKWKE